MRAFLFVPLAALSGAAVLTAQSYDANLIRQWDLTTEYISRGRVGGSTGHMSEAFSPGVLSGLDALTRVQFVMNEQNKATVEPFNFRVSPVASDGSPDYARGVNLNAKPLVLPGSSGSGSYIMTLTFTAGTGKPIRLSMLKDAQNKPLLDRHEVVHFGWQFLKATNWTADGLSVHMSQAGRQMPYGGQGPVTCWKGFHREIPRPEKFATTDPTNQIIERLAWSTIGGQSGSAFLDRSWRIDLFFDEPALQGMTDNKTYNNWPCPNPNPGYAALDPDFNDRASGSPARYDDYRWEVHSARHAGGVAVLFLSTSLLPNPVSLPGISGHLYLNPTDPLMALGGLPMGTVTSWGSAVFKLALGAGGAANSLRKAVASLPAIHAQAYLVKLQGGVSLALSGIWTLRPALAPAGFTRAQTVAGTPIKLAKGATDKTLYVRNDGLAKVTVEQFIGSSTTPIKTDAVAARTGLRVLLFPAATRIEIKTARTGKQDVAYRLNF